MTPLARRVRPITRLEYDRMVEWGLIGPDERVELIRGEIVEKMPQNPPHSTATTKVARMLNRLYDDRFTVRVQMPIALSGMSEPEPDVLLARGEVEAYVRAHPTPEDTLLVVEVADTTLVGDRSTKVPMYLAQGVPEVWLVDLAHRRVLRYRREGGDPIVPEVLSEADALPIGGGFRVVDLLP